jgi:hypothetical protein
MIDIVSRHFGFAAAVLLAGCSDLREEPRGDLFIRSVLALEPGQCTARDDPEAPTLGFGRLDLEFGEPYVAPLLVGNSLPDDVRGAALRSYTVRVADEAGKVLKEFSSVGNGFVPPPSANGPGWGIMFVELVPLEVSGDVAAYDSMRVNATVRVFGELGGGLGVESSELTHPIGVCRGCMVAYPASAIDANGQCSQGEFTGEEPCKFGQDFPVDCRLCPGISACQAIP